jgi:hypothetical protein
MSYILNALKQSENQRGRGDIPHIDTPQELASSYRPVVAQRLWRWWALLVSAALLVLLGWVVAGKLWLTEDAAPVSVAPPVATAALPPPEVVVADEVFTAPEPPAQVPVPVPGLQQLQDVAGLRVQLEETAAPLSERTPVQLQLPERAGRVAAQAAPPPALTASIEAPRVAIPPRRELDESAPQGADLGDVAHWKNLPSAVQRQLRELGINAHVYSTDSKLRFIRASGRSLREGDRLSAELRLQQITRDGMVFTYQDGKYWMRLN